MIFLDNLATDIDRLGEIRVQLKALETEAEALTTSLKMLAKRHSKSVLVGNKFSIQISEMKFPDRMNVKSAIAQYGRDWLIKNGHLIPGGTTLKMMVAPIGFTIEEQQRNAA